MLIIQRIAILCLASAGAMAVDGTAKSQQGRAPLPKSVEAIPLAKCTPREALSVDYLQSSDRQAASAKQGVVADQKMEDLVGSLPHVKEPVSKLMNSEQTAEFEKLKIEMDTGELSRFAESRLQRDDEVMMNAAYAVGEMEKGAFSEVTKSKERMQGGSIVFLLRKILANYQDLNLRNPDPNVCSIDLALYREERLSAARVLKFAKSPEFQMTVALRNKYHVSGVLDPAKLPSPDREKAAWLLKAVVLPFQRSFQAAHDWQNLRRFAAISELEYQTTRNDIVSGCGSDADDCDKSINAAFAAADPATKETIKAWNGVDSVIPSEEATLFKQWVVSAKRAEGK